jgi:hypothetical protein
MLLQQQRHQPDLVRQRVAAVVDGGDVLAGALEEVGEGLAVGLVEGEEEFVEGVEVALGEGDGELRQGHVGDYSRTGVRASRFCFYV